MELFVKDIVEVVEDDFSGREGMIGTIISISDEKFPFCYEVEFEDGDSTFFTIDELSLVMNLDESDLGDIDDDSASDMGSDWSDAYLASWKKPETKTKTYPGQWKELDKPKTSTPSVAKSYSYGDWGEWSGYSTYSSRENGWFEGNIHRHGPFAQHMKVRLVPTSGSKASWAGKVGYIKKISKYTHPGSGDRPFDVILRNKSKTKLFCAERALIPYMVYKFWFGQFVRVPEGKTGRIVGFLPGTEKPYKVSFASNENDVYKLDQTAMFSEKELTNVDGRPRYQEVWVR